MDSIQDYIVNLYDTIENAADPRTKTWWLMSSFMYPISLVVLYLFLIFSLPIYMKSRPAYELKGIIRVYNLVQIVLNIIMIYWALTSGWFTTYDWLCEPVDYSNDPMAMRMARCVHFAFLIKLSDFIETIFFLLRKKNKQVSFLHVYHHVNMFLLGWMCTRYLAGGAWSIFMPINGTVHVLMYTYYFLSSFGPKMQKKLAFWKQRLTAMQLIQFGILFIYTIGLLRPSCKFQAKYMSIIFLPTLAVFTKEFWNFYQINYKKKHFA